MASVLRSLRGNAAFCGFLVIWEVIAVRRRFGGEVRIIEDVGCVWRQIADFKISNVLEAGWWMAVHGGDDHTHEPDDDVNHDVMAIALTNIILCHFFFVSSCSPRSLLFCFSKKRGGRR